MGSSYYHFHYLKFSYVYYYIDNNEKMLSIILSRRSNMETYMIIPNELATKGFAVYKELGKFYVMENGARWSEGFWSYNDAINAIRGGI